MIKERKKIQMDKDKNEIPIEDQILERLGNYKCDNQITLEEYFLYCSDMPIAS